MLQVNNLEVAYGGIKALRGVNLHIDEGEIVAVLGSNGAGKSTLLKAISALLKPTSGEILFEGKPLPKVPYRVTGMGIVQVPEGRQVFPNLSVYENLRIGCFLRNNEDEIQEDLKKVYHYFPRLEERRDQYAGLLSGGEQQMLALGRGLMAKPRIMLVDEPSLGLAPIIVNQIFEMLSVFNKEQHVALLLVEQNAYKALSIADRGYLLSTGVVEMEGKAEDLLATDDIKDIYLGRKVGSL
mgnify:CR=1 FL=1